MSEETNETSTPAVTALRTIMRDRNKDHASRAAGKFAKAVQPIYGSTPRGEPVHIGSATLLDVNGTKVMITAAHVIDENDATSLYVGGGPDLELIEAEFSVTVAPGNVRRLDHYDIAFCALPERLIEKLDTAYIGLDDVARYVPYENGRLYTCFGYPNTMNKVGWKETKVGKIRPEMLQYTNPYRRDEEVARKLEAGGENHVFIPYVDRWQDEDGFVDNAKSPIGMSGGAVIDCGKAADPNTAAGLNDPPQRLAGIGIEYRERRVMIATRMAVILPRLEQAFPPRR